MGKKEVTDKDKEGEKKTRIKIRGGSGGKLEINENADASKKKKEKEYTGSRWTAVWLLILTLAAGVWFYIQGSGGWRGIQLTMPEWGGKSEWVFER